VFKKIKPIAKGFTASEDDDLNPLHSWFKKMLREDKKITFDDLADENPKAIPKMREYALCALTKQVMKKPVFSGGNHYEKHEYIKFQKENSGLDVKDLDLQPAEEAVKVICRMVGDKE